MADQRELPVYCVQTDSPQIALSFDASWGNEETQHLLDILAAHNVKATFFSHGRLGGHLSGGRKKKSRRRATIWETTVKTTKI